MFPNSVPTSGALLRSVVMTVAARVVNSTVFMVSVPPTIEMPTVRVAVHVAPMTRPRIVHLAVLMVAMPPAIQMSAMRVSVHMTVVMAMSVVTLYVLRLLSMACRMLASEHGGCRVSRCTCQGKNQHGTHQRQLDHPEHGIPPCGVRWSATWGPPSHCALDYLRSDMTLT